MDELRPDRSSPFDEIFAQYRDPIYSYVYHLMGNSEDAEDFTQDTFVKAFIALERTPEDLKLKPWLYRIATNVCLDEMRRRKIIRWQPWEGVAERFVSQASHEPGPETQLIAQEDAATVQEVLKLLHPRHRLALLLREFQHLSYDEMAHALKTTQSAVKSLLFRAREEFRKAYILTYGHELEQTPVRRTQPRNTPSVSLTDGVEVGEVRRLTRLEAPP
ncbi:MAG: RNA polymerase sigma factor [Chloroflexi bacterium]|nr:RNA polymerase sigma factor [Chloroflexota bacterium]